jgi:hypothetical protein
MGNLAITIPFTELWERLLTMGRVDVPNNEDYAKGLINDTYTRSLPRSVDWDPLVKESFLSMTAYYNTGTATVAAGATAVTGIGTTWTSAMVSADGYKIKFSGNDNVYTFDYVGATSGTISPALSGATSLATASYTIFRDEYSLASDFNRLLQNGSVYLYSGGRVRDIVEESPRDKFREDFSPEVTDPIQRVMLTRTHDTTGYRLIRVNPPPKTAKVYPYEYIQLITPMTDYSEGTVTVTNGSADVVGVDTYFTANVAVGDYFRVDGNGTGNSSKWYKITTVTDNTHLTLSANYGEYTESGVDYHASKTPSAFPVPFHEFILYEAVLKLTVEQSDPIIKAIATERDMIMKDLKKNYRLRRTNVQYGADDDGARSWQ